MINMIIVFDKKNTNWITQSAFCMPLSIVLLLDITHSFIFIMALSANLPLLKFGSQLFMLFSNYNFPKDYSGVFDVK